MDRHVLNLKIHFVSKGTNEPCIPYHFLVSRVPSSVCLPAPSDDDSVEVSHSLSPMQVINTADSRID